MMAHKTLFRTLLKVLGVAFIFHGAAGSAGHMMTTAAMMMSESTDSLWEAILVGQIYSNPSGFLLLLAGLYFFFGGKWVTNLAFPNNHTYCGGCGWDLTRITEDVCPECGIQRNAAEATVGR